MSVKHSLLALLIDGPRYGAALRSDFEARTGHTWPLNVGQVYTTLGRLERDGLVTSQDRSASDDSTIAYALTDAGRAEVERWWTSPVDRSGDSRDQLAIKLAMAVTVPGVDIGHVVQVQRVATIGRLQHLTRLKRSTRTNSDDLPWTLVLDHMTFTAEAEVRWLDHVEALVRRSTPDRRAGAAVNQGIAAPPARHPSTQSVIGEASPTGRKS